MQTIFGNARMVKAWYDEIADYDFGNLTQVDATCSTKSVQSNGSLTCHSFLRTYLRVLSHEELLIWCIIHCICHSVYTCWQSFETLCLVVGFSGTAQKCQEYFLHYYKIVPYTFSTSVLLVFGPSWSWLLDSGFSKVATSKRVQVILLKLFGKDRKRRFSWSWWLKMNIDIYDHIYIYIMYACASECKPGGAWDCRWGPLLKRYPVSSISWYLLSLSQGGCTIQEIPIYEMTATDIQCTRGRWQDSTLRIGRHFNQQRQWSLNDETDPTIDRFPVIRFFSHFNLQAFAAVNLQEAPTWAWQCQTMVDFVWPTISHQAGHWSSHEPSWNDDTDTLPKTNIAPENRPSQKETNTPTIHFQGRAVSFREGKWSRCLTGMD